MDADPWLGAKAVARELGVSRSTVWRYSRETLPYIETGGGQRRYRDSDVQRLKGGDTLAARVSKLEDRVTRLEETH